MKISRFLKILLVITFLKGIIYAYFIPPLQSPDEQNHFAYAQYIAEVGKKPNNLEINNTSLELIKFTKIINFDWSGNHPMWKEDIFLNADSKENEIRSIPVNERKVLVSFFNGSKYPPLYYFLGSFFYKFAAAGSIIERLYSVRIMSVFFAVLSVYLTYKISLLITKKPFLSLTTSALVAFQPSFSNITSTITNDAMAIFSVTLAVFFLISKSLPKAIFGGFLALLTRAHLGILFFYAIFRKNLLFVIIFGIILLFIAPINPPDLPFDIDKFLEGTGSIRNILTNGNIAFDSINYLKYSFSHYKNEVFSWYWGVFGWLEITLYPAIYTIFKILIFISIFGFLIKRKNPYPKINPALISASLLFLIIILFDFITFVQNGTGAGVQGRHLIPAIAVHILVLLIGIELLIPAKLHNFLRKSLILFMVSVNFISLYEIINYFYAPNLKSILYFKPVFISIPIIISISLFYLILLLHFLYSVSRLTEDE